MKTRMKKIICLLTIATLAFSVNVPTFAGGKAFNFTVKKNSGTVKSGVVKKNDAERKAYVTIKSVSWNKKGSWVFGARVRTSKGKKLTNYYTTRKKGPMKNGKTTGLPFLSGIKAYKGMPCRLHAQVDGTSQATVITAKGVWLP